jgi:hypothetical protein
MKKTLTILACLFLVAAACTTNENDGTQQIDSTNVIIVDTIIQKSADTTPVTLKEEALQYTPDDEVNLLLFEKFSLGISYAQLKNKISSVKPLHAEDYNEQVGAKGLQESIQDITFLNYKGKLEFNFKQDTLYRYSIVFNEPNEKKGNKLYQQVLTYYNNHLGVPYQPVNIEEDNHYAELNMWYLNPDYLVAVYNLNTGNVTIAAQNFKPGQ